jgi:LysM repeat protein
MTTKRTAWTVFALIILFASAIKPVTAAPAYSYNYTVKQGDTLGSISRQFGVSPDRLIDLNNLGSRPNTVYVGETLTIPVEMSYTPSYVGPFFYVVQSGETVQVLIEKFAIDKYALWRANGLELQTDSLTAGTTLFIPAGPHRYRVKAGDTLQAIATLFGTTTNNILRLNKHLGNGTTLTPGREVYIPIVYDVSPSSTSSSNSLPPPKQPEPTASAVAMVGDPTKGLKPTDSAEVAQAANANVISGVGTITMPQNIVNLNSELVIRWMQLRHVQRDPSTQDGAILTFAIEFRGGTGTVTIQGFGPDRGGLSLQDMPIRGIYVNATSGELWNDIEVEISGLCGGPYFYGIIFKSGLQQAIGLEQKADCP